jgi:hypothetical protein
MNGAQLIAEWPEAPVPCRHCGQPIEGPAEAVITPAGAYHRSDACRPALADAKVAEEFMRIAAGGPRPIQRATTGPTAQEVEDLLDEWCDGEEWRAARADPGGGA